MKRTMMTVLAVTAVLALAGAAQAEIIPIVNAGMDVLYKPGSTTVTVASVDHETWHTSMGPSSNLAWYDGTWHDATATFSDATTGDRVDIAGWQGDGVSQYGAGLNHYGNLFVQTYLYYRPDGPNFVHQVLSDQLEANSTYRLTVDVLASGLDALAVVGLYAGSTLLTETQSTLDLVYAWETWTLTYATDATPESGDLKIVLGIANTEDGFDVSFDNVELEIIPEPATMGLLVAGGIATLLRRRRRA